MTSIIAQHEARWGHPVDNNTDTAIGHVCFNEHLGSSLTDLFVVAGHGTGIFKRRFSSDERIYNCSMTSVGFALEVAPLAFRGIVFRTELNLYNFVFQPLTFSSIVPGAGVKFNLKLNREQFLSAGFGINVSTRLLSTNKRKLYDYYFGADAIGEIPINVSFKIKRWELGVNSWLNFEKNAGRSKVYHAHIGYRLLRWRHQ